MNAAIAQSEQKQEDRRVDKRPRVQNDLDQILSDPELRATLKDIMAGLSEALDRIAEIERELKKRAASSQQGTATRTEGK